MHNPWRIVAAALALVLAASLSPVAAQQAQPQGCIAAGNCGTKGTQTQPGARRDYWYNWICSGCHTGPLAPLAPSPQELALTQVPVRFWTMHSRAEQDGETRMRAMQHGLRPTGGLAPLFRVLMQNRPAQGK